MSPTFDVGMIGASGTGKTSLLTSMYAQFRGALNETRLSLEPDDPVTSMWLQQQRAQLERIASQIRVREQGIPGSMESRTLTFKLMTTDKKNYSHLDMRFTDYPGGWLFPADERYTSEAQDLSDLRQRLHKSTVVLVAVDTPALMYEEGVFHQEINRAQQVDEILSDWLKSGKKRLVVFVPLKCEKWVKKSSKDEFDKLYGRVLDGYPEALATLERDDDVKVTCSPDQTVGSLDHLRISVQSREGIRHIESEFQGRTAKGKYAPRWATEPLRQVLLSLIESRQDKNSLWENFTRLFGHQDDLDHATKTLRKSEMGPFERWKG